MANVFTDLEQDALAALDTVSREQVGLITAVRTDFSAENLAKDRVIRSFVSPESSAQDTAPGQLPPNDGDQTFTNKTLTISKDRHVGIRWTAEDMLQMNGGGPGANAMMQDQIAQAYRVLANEVEADLAAEQVNACRAQAPTGTTLFDSTGGIKDIAAAKQILMDNGAPMGDLQLVLGSNANVNYLGIPNLYKANEAADTSFLRQGVLGKIFGVDVRHSPEIVDDVVKGTASSATVDNAGYAIGATVLTLSSAGTGTILAGDILVFAGDSDKYVVASGDADVSNGGTITIQAPGLRVAMSTATKTITVQDQAERNMIFDRNAIVLATRLPAYIPGEEDQRVVAQDPRSGLAFQILTYKEYKQFRMEVGLAWGFNTMKNAHSALLVD